MSYELRVTGYATPDLSGFYNRLPTVNLPFENGAPDLYPEAFSFTRCRQGKAINRLHPALPP
jgi:hypothetical protein